MISLKVRLRPQNDKPIDADYNYFLVNLIQNYLDKKEYPTPYDNMLPQYLKKNVTEEDEPISFSSFLCNTYNRIGDKLLFKEDVSWLIYCSSYNKLLKLVQGLYKLGKITIGEAIFEIVSIEAKQAVRNSESIIKNKILDRG